MVTIQNTEQFQSLKENEKFLVRERVDLMIFAYTAFVVFFRK